MLAKSIILLNLGEALKETLVKTQFFSILMDGSTDIASVDYEIFLALWCDTDGNSSSLCTHMSYFAVRRPKSVTAAGLLTAYKIVCVF